MTAQDGSDRPFTRITNQIGTHQPLQTPFQRTLPGSQVVIDSFDTAYTTHAKGLSEWQIRKACDKAWVGILNEMQIVNVPDHNMTRVSSQASATMSNKKQHASLNQRGGAVRARVVSPSTRMAHTQIEIKFIL